MRPGYTPKARGLHTITADDWEIRAWQQLTSFAPGSSSWRSQRFAFEYSLQVSVMPKCMVCARIHRICGYVILAAILWVALGAFLPLQIGPFTPLFVGEVVSVYAFAVSWFVKGRDLYEVRTRAEKGILVQSCFHSYGPLMASDCDIALPAPAPLMLTPLPES